jgi:16S rRNA (cytidine1402-2'-O)-methyltransferase
MKIADISLRPGLYIVSTPIGNLRDVTLRALDTLAAADAVFCEDTRVSAKLLNAYGLKKKLSVYNDHSSEQDRGRIVSAIAEGKSVALVSDAGTPLVSDPGYKLVRECLERGLYVTSLPGANAPLTALQLSGLPSDCFTFLGFLPAKTKARAETLARWKGAETSLVLFESGPRLPEALAAMHEVLGDRNAAVVREITKLYEEGRRGPLGRLAAHYAEQGGPKGEIVVVIAPPEATAGPDADELEDLLRRSLETQSVKDAVAGVALATGLPRKAVYEAALSLQKKGA